MNYNEVKELFKKKGYTFFEGELNLNIFAKRKVINTNVFDDEFYVVYQEGGKNIVKKWACATEPGKTYMLKPLHKDGSAIIVEGQYRGAFTFGLHQGKYECLRQHKPLKYNRDNNKDTKHDIGGKVYEEIAYTNIHHAGKDSGQVDSWSAGCVVFKRIKDFNEMMSIAKKSAKLYGDKFTFTMINDFK